MDDFLCYYCSKGSENLEEILEHIQAFHHEHIIKVRTLQLDEKSGQFGYRTINFNLIPAEIGKRRQSVFVKCNDPGSLALGVKNATEGPLTKKFKINDETPESSHHDLQMSSNVDSTSQESNVSDLDVTKEQMPSIIETLKKNGQFESWKMFHDLVYRNEFPLSNISYLLFLDVVKWFNCDNSVCMRYDEQVTKFWRIGYKLFHGKFLRFMGGPKHKGQITFGEVPRGMYDPSDAKINFAVPMSKVSDLNLSVLAPNDVKPGLIKPLLEKVALHNTDEKTYKICLDGKKINASKSGSLGDIDLFGFEKQPTLSERKDRLNHEIEFTEECLHIVEAYDDDCFLASILQTGAERICDKIQTLITKLGERVKDLRKTKMSRQGSLKKFKLMDGDNWRNSNLCNVISAISAQLYDINNCIARSMRLIDNLCALCSNLNGSYSRFSVENSVDLRLQENYRHLNYITDHSFRDDTLRFLKQKSDGRFIARSEATVTGSTLNSALGLDSLKSQQEHYDCNILGKDRQEPSSQIKEKMEYGTENELHAVATLVSKVLPVFFPTLIYSEVGCIKKAQNGVSFVISPDGLCENSMTDHDSAKNFAVEIKCPYPATPGTYKLPVYYSIPRYYIPQILSEMFALNVENFIFACYSKESTVVMIAKFDSDLWSMMQREIEKVYQRRSRPVKKSEGVPALKRRTELYIERNVKFLGEFQSVKGTECTGRTSTIDDPYCTHQNTMIGSQNRIVSELKEALVESTNVFKTAYQLNRTKASELLGFMISDLDRMSSPGQIPAVPIAFGLKGYSLSTDILRSMLEHVISECTKAGLYVPVCSFDGQWYRLTVRDRENFPLTLLHLQKDVYQEVRKLTIGNLLSLINDKNLVRCSSLEELKEVVDIEVKSSGGITVGKKKSDDSIHASYRIVRMIKDWKEGKYRQEQKKNKSKDINNSETDILSTLPVNVVENLPEEILDEVLTNEDESSSGIPVGLPTDSLDGIGVALRVAEDMASNGRTDNESEMSERRPSNQVETKLNLTRNDCASMLEVLRTSKSKKTWDMSAESFCQLFTNAETINKSFTKEELVAVIRPVMTKLNQHTQESDLRIRLSENKHQIVSKLSRILGDGSIQAAPARKLKKSPSKLSFITKAVLRKIPKEMICSLYSENIFPERAKEWYGKSPFGEEIRIKGLTGTGNWYSMPEYNVSTGNYLLMILDSYHQICGARRLVCQNGIPLKGVKREAFAKVALESESNGCQLSMAMVNDLIDKQNIAFACATFSEQVADALESIGEYSTAEFCRLIDMWYRADDDPGLSALDRCKYRLQLKEWLLDGISFYEFPPPGAYIKGIPVVLFEGLLTNIERKIQMYAFCKSGTYNVRSVGSLDIENFFGTFQDLDPKGTGVLRPDDIPAAISVAVELLDGKLDPNRGFEMETSRAKVYPTKKILTTSNSVCVDRKVSEGIRRDFKSIEAILSNEHRDTIKLSSERCYNKRSKSTTIAHLKTALTKHINRKKFVKGKKLDFRVEQISLDHSDAFGLSSASVLKKFANEGTPVTYFRLWWRHL